MKTISILLLLVLIIPGYSQINKEPIDCVDCFIRPQLQVDVGPYAGRPSGWCNWDQITRNGWMAG